MKLTESQAAWIDSVRGLSALSVVALHFGQQFLGGGGSFKGLLSLLGESGVAMFFVLSGFLIHSGGLAEQRVAGKIDWGRYAIRRFSRIYPGYLCALLVCALVAKYWQSELISPAGWLGFLAHVFLFSSFVPGESVSISGVFWTVVVECHFYALYPLLFGALRRFGALRTFGLFICCSVLFFVAVSLFVPPGPIRVLLQLSAPSLFWKWCIGAVLAHLYALQVVQLKSFSIRGALCAVILALLAGSQFLDPNQALNFHRFVLPLVSAFVLALLVTARCNGGRNRFTEWSGLVSYSIYLWHPIALLVASSLWMSPWSAFVVTGVVTYSIAVASYYFVEQPGVSLGKRLVFRGRLHPALSRNIR